MATAPITIEYNAQELRREIDAFLRLLPEKVIKPAVKKITFDVLLDIVRGITVDAPTRVDTGRYRAGYRMAALDGGLAGASGLPGGTGSQSADGSMTYSGDGIEFEAEVVNNVEYALFVEDGTAHMAPGNHVKRALATAAADVRAVAAELAGPMSDVFEGK